MGAGERRDELPIDIKAGYDGEYVERMSLLFDCKCFFLTILSVLKREGVAEGANAEAEASVDNTPDAEKIEE